uniref:HECT domain-containing protein n=1 Tax=Sphaeramia orbicularis TaxID=375764 RepID=A0A673BNW8_9TELE
KMEGLYGGWLLHKATGGSGRRKLTVIPPEAEGYTTKALQAVSKTCYQCNERMPLHMLAVHIKTCKGKLFDDDDGDDEVRANITRELAITYFQIILVYINLFGYLGRSQYFFCCLLSVEDVLLFLTHQIDTTTEFKLCVDREDLLDRGILQWKRKKTASPASALKGAVYCFFAKEMISGIENRFFEGAGNQGKNPKYSLSDLDNENFRTIGEIMAVSLAQGGPPPAFLKEWCYNFLCTGEIDFHSLSKEDSLMMYADEIVSCGYTSQIKLDSKESIIRAIILHSTTRLIPMLQQLRKGMGLYGLVDQMASNPAACHSLFVPGKITKVKILTATYFVLAYTIVVLYCNLYFVYHLVCYPTVSACTQTVTFPIQHLSTYTEFRRIMSEAVQYGGGFHRV